MKYLQLNTNVNQIIQSKSFVAVFPLMRKVKTNSTSAARNTSSVVNSIDSHDPSLYPFRRFSYKSIDIHTLHWIKISSQSTPPYTDTN